MTRSWIHLVTKFGFLGVLLLVSGGCRLILKNTSAGNSVEPTRSDAEAGTLVLGSKVFFIASENGVDDFLYQLDQGAVSKIEGSNPCGGRMSRQIESDGQSVVYATGSATSSGDGCNGRTVLAYSRGSVFTLANGLGPDSSFGIQSNHLYVNDPSSYSLWYWFTDGLDSSVSGSWSEGLLGQVTGVYRVNSDVDTALVLLGDGTYRIKVVNWIGGGPGGQYANEPESGNELFFDDVKPGVEANGTRFFWYKIHGESEYTLGSIDPNYNSLIPVIRDFSDQTPSGLAFVTAAVPGPMASDGTNLYFVPEDGGSVVWTLDTNTSTAWNGGNSPWVKVAHDFTSDGFQFSSARSSGVHAVLSGVASDQSCFLVDEYGSSERVVRGAPCAPSELIEVSGDLYFAGARTPAATTFDVWKFSSDSSAPERIQTLGAGASEKPHGFQKNGSGVVFVSRGSSGREVLFYADSSGVNPVRTINFSGGFAYSGDWLRGFFSVP